MTETCNIEQAVRSNLETLGVQYEWLVVDPKFADTAAFCEKYGYSASHSGNTIIVASKRGFPKFSACLILATERLDVNKKVRSLMQVSRLSFASEEATTRLTGMMLGGVTPFGLPEAVPIYVASNVMGADYVILGGGSRSAKIKIAPEEILKICGSSVIEDLSIH